MTELGFAVQRVYFYIVLESKQLFNIQKFNIMATLTIETKTSKAIVLVILDALEKGHTNTNDLIAYMKSETFEKAVANYVTLFNEN